MELNRPYRKTNIPAILNKALICAEKEIKMNPWEDIVRDQWQPRAPIGIKKSTL